MKKSNSCGCLNLDTTSTTTNINMWSEPRRIRVDEYSNRVEMILKQTSLIQNSIYPPREPEERVFKIVFSCKDGKWHKSEPIYGKIIPANDESYEFED